MSGQRTLCFLFVLILCHLQKISASDTLCGENEVVGIDENNLNSYDNNNPDGGTTNMAYLHTGGNLLIGCCGILDRYRVETDNGGELYMMIWRPVAAGYKLISHLYENCNNNDRCDINAIGADRITVKSGDLYGWYTPNAEVMEYTISSGVTLVRQQLTPFFGMVDTWTTGTSFATITDRIHGINIRLDANTAPTFSLPANPTVITILESDTIGTTVYTAVSASDTDVSDDAELIITMTANTYFGYTNTSSTAGEVTIISSISSAPSQVDLDFTVTDQCHNTDTGTLRINIDNVPPAFDNPPATVLISEHTSSITPLVLVNVTDYNDVIACFVDAVTPTNANTNTASFVITKITDAQFNLTTSNVAQFYYTAESTHDVSIRCNDGEDDSYYTVTVNLIRNVPVSFSNLPNSTTLSEDVNTEQLLIRLTYTDTDQPISDTTISLGAGSTPVNFNDFFRIRQINGTNDWGIFTKHGITFNYTQASTFVLQVEADDGRDITTETYTVNLLANSPPTITNLPGTTFVHSDSPIGYEIFDVAEADAEGDAVTFTLTCSPTCAPFTILSDGKILLNQDISNQTNVGYNLTITVSDYRNTGETKQLAVHITGINDPPVMTTLNTNINILEERTVGSYIANATCTDTDVPATDTLVYSLSCTPAWGSSYFNISDSDGVIRILSVIDYETIPVASDPKTVTCTATCSDGLASSTATLGVTILNVNEPPVHAQSVYNINIDEWPKNTNIYNTSLLVTDEDTGDTLTYGLDCGNNTGLMRIDTMTNIMQFGVDMDVDTGAPQSITCILIATDSGGLTSNATIYITIRNINDNAPVLSQSLYYFSVLKTSGVGTPVGTISATDGDIAPWKAITYSLDQTTLGCMCFGVSSAGLLTVGQSLTGFNSTFVTFTAIANDPGSLTDTATVTVFLTEIATTIRPDRYWEFIDDPRSIGWLVAAIVAFAVAAGVMAYMVFTAKSTASTSSLKWQCCKIRRVFTPKRSRIRKPSRSRSPVPQSHYRQFPQIKPV